MSGAISNLIILVGVATAGWYLWTQTDFLNFIKTGGKIDFASLFKLGGGGAAAQPASGGGATAASGKMIYQGTGKVLTGDLAVKDAKENYGLASGGSRPSSRYIWGSGKGKGAAKCVDYNSYEATVYVTFGTGGKPASNTRAIITGGGPGQRGKNCCVYSLGFVTTTGQAFAEEEGAHEPKPTIEQMDVVGGAVKNIGKLSGRTIGLKEILIRNNGAVRLEGWVDKQANGNWELFYRANDPHGGSLPVITHTGMVGEKCGEVRFRCDGIWPVTMDTSRSFIAEIPDTAVASSPHPPAAATTTATAKTPKKPATKKSKLARSFYTYNCGMMYTQPSPISTLYGDY